MITINNKRQDNALRISNLHAGDVAILKEDMDDDLASGVVILKGYDDNFTVLSSADCGGYYVNIDDPRVEKVNAELIIS